MLRSIRRSRTIPIDTRLALATLALVGGCLVDTDERCDENQTVLEGDFGGCVCAPGSVLNAAKNGCTKCGAHEVVKENACTCETGFARLTPGGECSASQLEAACSATAPCGGEYPYCAAPGYCTKGTCAASSECPAGFACELKASPVYCSRPPTGLNSVCDATTPCTGEANYCAMGACAVSGCATTKTCHGDSACCDYTSFGLADICIPGAKLMAGKCPGTGTDPVVRK